MSNKRTNIPTEPCEECAEVEKCQDRGPFKPCKVFRRYENNGQGNASKWVPADRGVFDGVGV